MRILDFYRSTIGKKVTVAVTGAVMISFLLLHVYGNFHVYFGAQKINDYSVWLREFGEHLFGYGGLLWIIRVVVGGALVLHVIAVAQLIARNRAARPVGYRKTSRRKRIIIGMTMAVSGLLILFFLVFHILQFTTGTIHPTPFHEKDGIGIVYINLQQAFQVWWIAWIYIGAVALVGIHIYHGAWSFFQTLGWNNPDRNRMFRWVALLLGFGLFAGFASVPLLFWTGVLPPPQQSPEISASEPAVSHATEMSPWN